MMKKKIAVIGLKGLPAFGEAATVGENIIKKLKDKYDFTVYAIDTHATKKDINGCKQIIMKSTSIKTLNIPVYYCYSAFHAFFKCNCDVIHLHHRTASFILILLRLKYKIILTLHGTTTITKWKKFKLYFIS